MNLKLSTEQLESIVKTSEQSQLSLLCRSICGDLTAETDFYPKVLCELNVRIFLINLSAYGVTEIAQQIEVTKKYFLAGRRMTQAPYGERWRQIMLNRNLSTYLKGKELIGLLNTALEG